MYAHRNYDFVYQTWTSQSSTSTIDQGDKGEVFEGGAASAVGGSANVYFNECLNDPCFQTGGRKFLCGMEDTWGRVDTSAGPVDLQRPAVSAVRVWLFASIQLWTIRPGEDDAMQHGCVTEMPRYMTFNQDWSPLSMAV